MSDPEKNLQVVLRKQMDILDQYDGLRAQITPDSDDHDAILAEVRSRILTSLKSTLIPNEETYFEQFYENILYDCLYDQLRRAYGYNKALERYDATVKEFNDAAGDQVLEFGPKEKQDTTQLLEKLDELHYIRVLAPAVGVMPEDVDKIITYKVDRLFGRGLQTK